MDTKNIREDIRFNNDYDFYEDINESNCQNIYNRFKNKYKDLKLDLSFGISYLISGFKMCYGIV